MSRECKKLIKQCVCKEKHALNPSTRYYEIDEYFKSHA